MRGQNNNHYQEQVFSQTLESTLNPRNAIYQLSHIIPWQEFDLQFSNYYSRKRGRPGKAVRLMTSLLILKQMYDLSDEEIVTQWIENPYWQYFSGETEFQWEYPCDPSELTKFRNRIGREGVEKIFEVSIKLHGKKAMERELIPDTTVQEKNITFPTDTKLNLKVIEWVWRVSEQEEIELRQSYKRTVPELRWNARYLRVPTRVKGGRKAVRKIKTIARRLLRDLERKMQTELKRKYEEYFKNCHRIINQKRNDKDKIYSLHEPEVSCIAKGKEHKKYEFGSKVSILLTKESNIIVGAVNFQGNPYDGKTLPESLEQYKRLMQTEPTRVLVDEGYRGKDRLGETEILHVHKKRKNGWSRWRWNQRFKRRAAVEPVIGHLKQDYRLGRNFLKGSIGDSINLMLSCAAFNFKKLLNDLQFILSLIETVLKIVFVPKYFYKMDFEISFH